MSAVWITSGRAPPRSSATWNLDERTGQEILETLLGLSAQGTALVVVTHSPEVARRASRVLTVRDGRLEG